MTRYKIKDNENLVRDTKTNAVLNTDLTSLEQYKMRREIEMNRDSEIKQMKEDIRTIKSLLSQLIVETGK
jgi:hypothetical protein